MNEVVCQVTVCHPDLGYQTVAMPEEEAFRLLRLWPFVPPKDVP